MEFEDLKTAKKALRRECFAAIRTLSDAQKLTFSAKIVDHLQEWPVFQSASTLGIYIAVKSEPDLSELIRENPEKTFSLAKIDAEGLLHFHRIQSLDDLVIGEFGIAEPNPSTCPAVDDSDLDLILVPGVAFNPANGARLGRGKGHYDRFLERLRKKSQDAGRQCLVAGVSFSVQHRGLTAEAHDQAMDFLVTEAGILPV